jgi:hypothetical protein
MRPIIEGPPDEGQPKRPLGARLLWVTALGSGGLIAVAGVAYGLRALIM